MDDFNGLAASLAAGVTDVRGCLILSRDGLVLGSYPEGAEEKVKPAWMRLAALGDVERGFLQYGTEVLCYVRRSPYSAFVVTGPGARPGLTIDQIEQALLAAEESRSRREGIRPVEPASTPAPPKPAARPRAPLHPDPRPDEQPLVIHADVASAVSTSADAAVGGAAEPAVSAGRSAADEPPSGGEPGTAEAPGSVPAEGRAAPDWNTGGDDEEVDRFSLARELSQLLQDDEKGADG